MKRPEVIPIDRWTRVTFKDLTFNNMFLERRVLYRNWLGKIKYEWLPVASTIWECHSDFTSALKRLYDEKDARMEARKQERRQRTSFMQSAQSFMQEREPQRLLLENKFFSPSHQEVAEVAYITDELLEKIEARAMQLASKAAFNATDHIQSHDQQLKLYEQMYALMQHGVRLTIQSFYDILSEAAGNQHQPK